MSLFLASRRFKSALPCEFSKSAKLSSSKVGVGLELAARILEISKTVEEISRARDSRFAMIDRELLAETLEGISKGFIRYDGVLLKQKR